MSMIAARFFGVVAFLLGVAGLSLAAIALGTTRWIVDTATNEHGGLFEYCGSNGCTTGTEQLRADFNRATQAFMIMGCFLVLVNLFVCLTIAVKKGYGKLHIVAGTLYLVAGIFLLIACAVYTGVIRPTMIGTNQIRTFGFSLWLAWASEFSILLATPFGYLAKEDKSKNFV